MKSFIIACLIISCAFSLKFGEIQAPLVDHINSKQSSWTAGINERFADMTIEEIQHLMGALEENVHEKLPATTLEAAETIPESFDSRTQWPDCESIREIRDQSNCGSCWAFGAAEAMSDRICVASGQKDQTRLSTEDLTGCCSECGYGCNGGYPSSAWSYYASTGLVTGDLYSGEGCLPYSLAPCSHHVDPTKYPACPSGEEDISCKSSCQSSYTAKSWSADKHKGGSAFSVSGISKIQTEIMTNGPVEAAFTVYADFPTYKTGVYKHVSGSQLGGHAIKIIGWGVESGQDYWIVVNSWNETWGDNGTFKIARGSDECGIEDGIVAGHAPASNMKFLAQ